MEHTEAAVAPEYVLLGVAMSLKWLPFVATLWSLLGCKESRASLTAGEIGCRPSEIAISEETVANDGFWKASENWVAECLGRRFICTEVTRRHNVWVGGQTAITTDSDVSCTAEQSSSESSNASSGPAGSGLRFAPPTGAAGFELGDTAQGAQDACRSAGHEWQVTSDSQATCSNAPVSIGLPTSVSLGLCAGTVCRITLMHQPQRNWLGVITMLRTSLERKYGEPGRRDGRLPDECRPVDAFVDCLKTRKARLRYVWSWGTGQNIALLAGIPPEGGEAAVRLTYAGGAAEKANGSAL